MPHRLFSACRGKLATKLTLPNGQGLRLPDDGPRFVLEESMVYTPGAQPALDWHVRRRWNAKNCVPVGKSGGSGKSMPAAVSKVK